MQAGEDVLGLVRRTRAHPSYADCYTLPSYGKCWRRAARGAPPPTPPPRRGGQGGCAHRAKPAGLGALVCAPHRGGLLPARSPWSGAGRTTQCTKSHNMFLPGASKTCRALHQIAAQRWTLMDTAPLDACHKGHANSPLQPRAPEMMRTDHAAAALCGSEMCETTSDTRALVRVCVVDRAGRTVLQVRLRPLLAFVPCHMHAELPWLLPCSSSTEQSVEDLNVRVFA